MNPVRNIVRSGHLLSAARPALRSPALPVLAVSARRGYHEKDMLHLFLGDGDGDEENADKLKLLDHYTNPRNG